MSYAVKLTAEALAQLLAENLPAEILDCMEDRLRKLADEDDPLALSQPADFPLPKGMAYPFQCAPEFFTVVYRFDEDEQTIWVVHVHREPR